MKLDARELSAILGRATAPRRLDRAGRVRLLVEAADALLAGRAPGAEAAAFLGAALSGWLARGGDLERDFLEVRAPRGSHLRPDRLRALIADEGTLEGGALPSGTFNTRQESEP